MRYLAARKETLIPDLKAVWQRTNFRELGIWTEVFGDGPLADEVFQAWHVARYIGRVAAAPSIDLLAPDIYLDDFKAVCAEYTQTAIRSSFPKPAATTAPGCAPTMPSAITTPSALRPSARLKHPKYVQPLGKGPRALPSH